MAEPAQIIRWENPPPPSRVGRAPRSVVSRYAKVAVELIARRGDYAVIRESQSRSTADNVALRIRRAEISCFAPAGDFDAVVRLVGGVHCVYACYLGDGDES